MLNLIHRLIHTGHIELCIPERETRQNVESLTKSYVPRNDIVAKSPVFITGELWNVQPVSIRNIIVRESFKSTVRKKINEEYVAAEIARITAGLFC